MVDFWRVSNGGAMAPVGCRRFGSDGRAMTVSAWFRFFGSGPLLFLLTYYVAPALDVGPLADCPNRLLRYQMTR
jgi:hypothetical protein